MEPRQTRAQPHKKCTHTTLLTLIIVSHFGTACVGGRWGEMWPDVAPSVGDSVSNLHLFEPMSCWWNKPMLFLWCWWSCPVFLSPCVCGLLQNCSCHFNLVLYWLFLETPSSGHFPYWILRYQDIDDNVKNYIFKNVFCLSSVKI